MGFLGIRLGGGCHWEIRMPLMLFDAYIVNANVDHSVGIFVEVVRDLGRYLRVV